MRPAPRQPFASEFSDPTRQAQNRLRFPVVGRRSPRALALAAWLVIGVCLGGPAKAQNVVGAMQGTILAPDGGPEADVLVTVAGPHLQGSRSTTTDRHGFFQFLALPHGTYELRVGRIGSRPILVRGILVVLGRATAVPRLTLTPQPIQMDSVVVIAPPVSLDPVNTTMGGVLTAKDYAALPMDRDYKSIISILPHANDSHRGDPVNVGGATGLENQYYIEGVNVNDVLVSNRATSLPYNFVRSVDVRTGAYEAQYGRALGAVVNAVTYSGTNQFETNIFGIAQPGELTMDPAGTAVLREQGAIYYDVGARVSGPLMRDRLWYSAAVNPRIDRVDKEIEGHGLFSDEATAVRFAGKLTWRASSAANLEFSLFGDPTTKDDVEPGAGASSISSVTNPDPYLGRVTEGGTVAALRATVAPSRSLLFETSVAGQWDHRELEGSTARGKAEELYIDYVASTIGGGFGVHDSDDRNRMSGSARARLTRPRHTVVAGVDYVDLEYSDVFATTGIGIISRLGASRYVVSAQAVGPGTWHNRSPAVFVQDTWRPTDRLAVNAGLRWSAQYLIGESGNTAERITDEWQPRIGFAWQLGTGGTQRVFGSYGRYYQTIPLNLIVLAYSDFTSLRKFYSTDPRQPGAVPDSVQDRSRREEDLANQVPDLEAENLDEFTLGYERLVGKGTTLTVRGIRRNLQSSYQYGVDQNNELVIGTPGEGEFSYLPRPTREYTALEVSAEGQWRRVRYRASYVLSRSWGNYPGLFDSDKGVANPGHIQSFALASQARNSTGFLPNDHPHVFKLTTAYITRFGLVGGAFLTFESGSPINELGPGPSGGTAYPTFRVERGTAGRTPALWNLDVRLAYDLPTASGPKTQILLDFLHIGNPQDVTRVNEVAYRASGPNPDYLRPLAYQPPMAVRLGVEVNF